nr:MAG TPA: hypothetical protein [Caudoviricetes sp.]
MVVAADSTIVTQLSARNSPTSSKKFFIRFTSLSSRTRRAADAIRCTDVHLLLIRNELDRLGQAVEVSGQTAAHIVHIDLFAADSSKTGSAVGSLCMLDDLSGSHQEPFAGWFHLNLPPF